MPVFRNNIKTVFSHINFGCVLCGFKIMLSDIYSKIYFRKQYFECLFQFLKLLFAAHAHSSFMVFAQGVS